MTERSKNIDTFLASVGWEYARRTPLAGDASFRRYERVSSAGERAVLMDAPPEKENVRPFMQVAKHLAALGLSAPNIIAADEAQGFLLLEDLGDDIYTPLLRRKPNEEKAIYLAAADALVELYYEARNADYRGFAPYDTALLMRECGLFIEWFLPAILPDQAEALGKEYAALWQELLPKIPALRPVLVLRDFHADNLLWLPDRAGVKRVGLLDFQDAVIGSPAYDIVSFLEDARRDVNLQTSMFVREHYLRRTGIPRDDFMAAYAILGAQRNCKIIGIFVRLAARDGKLQYLSYLARVWRHLENDLLHPLLEPLKVWMDKHVPMELRGTISIENLASKGKE